ncbi:Zinc-binding dehydrogenase [Mycena indigotica]|uniref:Zinc-binding dehydrogenase n=1 Tax=Mycena indigotica TaxID=2126181 RepID=A0A8H6S0Y7_9AGAR|nr:Zinc-binding dehydrogenase [Mycena indigotica]KAF7289872.1 Zinc-binding dehydrogenase [Mycena indigotica]
MNAVYYHGIQDFEVTKSAPIVDISEDQIQIKVSCCGICGTDSHIAKGEFIAQFPLIPGHEIVGTISKLGKLVSGFSLGDRVVADPGITCDECFYCRRGKSLLCENFASLGVTQAGGFAEYVAVASKKVYKIFNLSNEEATLVEPAACAVHGADKLDLPVGSEVLILGAGPTGLILAQLLKLNGAAKVVIAANKGIKTKIARQLKAADEYVEIDREAPEPAWKTLKELYPYGFDAVVEATGSETVANESINYVRRGGTLMVYGVYANDALVHWPPAKIFGDEIKIIGSFAQTHCFPRAVAYLDSGKVRVQGMVTDVFTVNDYQKALDKLESKTALKVVVKPS